jgi:hypothetical protein
MKVEKKQKAFYIFGYLLKLIIKKSSEFGEFFLEKSFQLVEIIFLKLNFGKIWCGVCTLHFYVFVIQPCVY